MKISTFFIYIDRSSTVTEFPSHHLMETFAFIIQYIQSEAFIIQVYFSLHQIENVTSEFPRLF